MVDLLVGVWRLAFHEGWFVVWVWGLGFGACWLLGLVCIGQFGFAVIGGFGVGVTWIAFV